MTCTLSRVFFAALALVAAEEVAVDASGGQASPQPMPDMAEMMKNMGAAAGGDPNAMPDMANLMKNLGGMEQMLKSMGGGAAGANGMPDMDAMMKALNSDGKEGVPPMEDLQEMIKSLGAMGGGMGDMGGMMGGMMGGAGGMMGGAGGAGGMPDLDAMMKSLGNMKGPGEGGMPSMEEMMKAMGGAGGMMGGAGGGAGGMPDMAEMMKAMGGMGGMMGGGAGGAGGGGMMGGGMPDLGELMKGLPSMEELTANMAQLKEMQESLKSVGETVAVSPEERRAQQEGLAQLLLALIQLPTPEERQQSLAQYAAAVAASSGNEDSVAQAEALAKEGVTPEEAAATVALLVLPDPVVA